MRATKKGVVQAPLYFVQKFSFTKAIVKPLQR